MTRAEFNEQIYDWDSLIDLANEMGCYDITSVIYTSEQLGNEILDECSEYNSSDWEDFARWVSDIPLGYDYYIKKDGRFDYADNDLDLDRYINELYDYMENHDMFDYEQEDEAQEDEEQEEQICPEEEWFDVRDISELLETYKSIDEVVTNV